MKDTALVQDGVVVQVWRKSTLERIAAQHPDLESDLVEFIGTGTVVCGMLWDGTDLSLPPASPDPVPTSVTKLQLVRALREADLKTAFDTALAAAPAETQEDWTLANVISRDDPLVTSFATALGKSEAETDDIFRTAATL